MNPEGDAGEQGLDLDNYLQLSWPNFGSQMQHLIIFTDNPKAELLVHCSTCGEHGINHCMLDLPADSLLGSDGDTYVTSLDAPSGAYIS